MILSVSRRTDIPALYTDWFFHRLQEGFVLVRNPMNHHQVSRVPLTPDVVDGIVFWTKNFAPMLPRLGELHAYPYYVQFTLTPYGPDLEPGLPDRQTLLATFRQSAAQLGPERVIWRYDPILLNPTYTEDFHLRAFSHMAAQLEGCTREVIISFIDTNYRNIRHNLRALALQDFPPEAQRRLAAQLASIARAHGMRINTCAETIDLSACGIGHAHCINAALLEQLAGCPLRLTPDRHQRPACGCAESIDIGAYNTCTHGCRYCYANYAPGTITANHARHNPRSPLLCGEIEDSDCVRARAVTSLRDTQQRLKESSYALHCKALPSDITPSVS